MKEYKVAVFVEKNKSGHGIKCRAYTRDYNPKWPGYNGVEIQAENGSEAKKKAVKFIKITHCTRPDLVKIAE